ncbi:MAG: acylneuraminate cytidylyltransferase family protein [Actinobacteria bacterium]|nr:MAG: acylneuraminate cytidylyltransferase family protein [Actinomycetota bacterium]
MRVVAIILARGGSKGLPGKNIRPFCGKPLLAWTIENCRDGGIEDIFVSSDSDEILEVGLQYGAKMIKRPDEISIDTSSSESGWLHGLDIAEELLGEIDWVFAPQVTSPLRDKSDVQSGIDLAKTGKYDSLFSCNVIEDFFIWEDKDGSMNSVNYDWRNRKRRQDIEQRYVENGSYYLFRSEILRKFSNRLGGRIGKVEMDTWKLFEIDNSTDFRKCEALMKEFLESKID